MKNTSLQKCRVCGAAVNPKKSPYTLFCDKVCRDAWRHGLDRGAEMELEVATEDLSDEAATARRQFSHYDYLSEENQPEL